MSEKTLIDFGWANSWSYDQDWKKNWPPLVMECRAKKHSVSDVDVGRPPNRGLEHVVKCEECGYVYRYDSSD